MDTAIMESIPPKTFSGEFGTIIASVPSLANPLWKGNTEFGYLRIYKGEYESLSTQPCKCIPMFYVLTEAPIIEHITGCKPNHGCFVYKTDYSINSIIEAFLSQIGLELMDTISVNIMDRKFNGTFSLQ